MLFVTDANNQTVTITMNQVQFAIFQTALEADQTGFERLMLSHLQQKQSEQEAKAKADLQAIVDATPTDQVKTLMDNLNGLKADSVLRAEG